MKTVIRRIVLIILCLAVPCAAMAESAAPADDVVHAEFTLGFGLHADGFPPMELHLSGWERFLKKLTFTGSLDGIKLLKPGSRAYLRAALCLSGEETIPFTLDAYGGSRYMISPMLRDDPVLLYMHSYFEFMLKYYYYLGLPANYVALLTYPDALWYMADSYYTPVSGTIARARAAALEFSGDEQPETLSYTIPYDELLTLCDGLNAVATGDTLKRVRWFLEALLVELYVSDVVLETLTRFDVLLAALDPGKQGMTVTETAEGMVCTIGGREIFLKTVSGGETEITLSLPVTDTASVSFVWRGETAGDAVGFAAEFSVAEGEDVLVWATAEGEGLPAEGSLGGEGEVSFAVGGSLIGEDLAPQTLKFAWSRTAKALPCDVDVTLDWLHPETGLPALSLYLSAALEEGDESVLVDETYPEDHFFGLNPDKLVEYKQRWTNSIVAYLAPVALAMPVGVIDDVVGFLLDSDILLSITE